ncbi:MAG: zinc dependent phospholipase C family protein [Cytophagales bacterium]|nr:zinc dependent phospholipase C family protein [Bernardetiaceae bacterium]MDW8209940.1 zinc dependent phospholipase C family protein [Cytophagales bacterium]
MLYSRATLLSITWLCVAFSPKGLAWGFYAHQRINRYAVFLLPPEMIGFYKKHIQFITEKAVNPDKRRYVVVGEAERHYIDLDVYGDSAFYKMPRRWEDALVRYSEDTLRTYGILPWNILWVKLQLTDAFQRKDIPAILRLSADLGHYIGDANVPLHTTENYNGQKTGQHGIHGFWESRLPELFADSYDFFIGRAQYEPHPLSRAWKAIGEAHFALDSVLRFERELTLKMGQDRKYSYETRNGLTVKVYSKEFSTAYHVMLAGQVERRMRASIQMVADFWYTCWVDAGQPDLNQLLQQPFEEPQEPASTGEPLPVRPHEGMPFGWKKFNPLGCCSEPLWAVVEK